MKGTLQRSRFKGWTAQGGFQGSGCDLSPKYRIQTGGGPGWQREPRKHFIILNKHLPHLLRAWHFLNRQ
jgi:hypothetical protein